MNGLEWSYLLGSAFGSLAVGLAVRVWCWRDVAKAEALRDEAFELHQRVARGLEAQLRIKAERISDGR